MSTIVAAPASDPDPVVIVNTLSGVWHRRSKQLLWPRCGARFPRHTMTETKAKTAGYKFCALCARQEKKDALRES